MTMAKKPEPKPAKVRLVNDTGGEAHVAPSDVALWLDAGLGWKLADQ
jgi:hypothetical protein